MLSKTIKRVMVGGTLAALLAVGAVAGAQPPSPRGGEGPRFPVAAEVARVVRDATGLDMGALRQALRDGQTLAALITANGASVEAVTADVLAVAAERLDRAVADGRATRAQADALLAALPAQIEAVLNGEAGAVVGPDGRRGRGPLAGPRGRGPLGGPGGTRGEAGVGLGVALPRISEGFVLDVASAQTGQTARALREALRDGQTLAAVLAANGVTTDAFLDALEAEVAAVLAPAVANGRLSQTLADALAAEARLRVAARLTAAE